MRRATIILLVAGCSSSPAEGPRCEAGQILLGGTCRDLCNIDADCAGSIACVGGVCGPPCAVDADCGGSAVCGSGVCVCPAGGCPTAPPCLRDSVLCHGQSLEVCGADGELVSSTDCGVAGCNDTAAPHRCNECVPGSIGCAGSAAITCGGDGTILAQVDCSDGNDCTVDSCVPTIGCTHQNSCPCTSPADCDDGNPCTDDTCDGVDCANTDRVGGCDDGDACTAADACSGGACLAGAAVDCGANAECSSAGGEFTCSCSTGFFGTSITGGPAACEPAQVGLGSAIASASEVSVVLTGAAPVGSVVVAVVASGDGFGDFAVDDNRTNLWQRIVDERSCGQCGEVAVYWTHVSDALIAGDVVTADVDSGNASALWVFRSPGFPFVDQVGTGEDITTLAPTVTTAGPVSDSAELVVGAFATQGATTLSPSEAFTTVEAFSSSNSSGLIAFRQGTGLVGAQTFQASSTSSRRFSGVIATFYGGTPLPPTNLGLVHTANRRPFTVSWTGGRGNGGAGGCSVQVATSTGTWRFAGAANCDATTPGTTVNIPATADWYGGPWSSTTAQLVRNYDGAVLGAFAVPLTCAPQSSSGTPTPTIDEDCDGNWDDHTCTSCTWGSGTVYSDAYTACTNTSGVAATYNCNLAAEGVRRYTNGPTVGASPATAWSSDQFGVACEGSYTGAVTWTCTCSGCTYY